MKVTAATSLVLNLAVGAFAAAVVPPAQAKYLDERNYGPQPVYTTTWTPTTVSAHI